MQNDELDDIDLMILDLIKNNARMSYTDIGNALDISRISVKKRMLAMEERGTIKGYQTVVDEKASPTGTHFYMTIETQPEHYESVLERLAYEKKIRQIYTTTGNCRIHAVGYASNTQAAGHFARTVFGNKHGIVRLEWEILASVVKDVDGGVEYERTREEGNDFTQHEFTSERDKPTGNMSQE